MKLDDYRSSDNVEDRRADGPARSSGGSYRGGGRPLTPARAVFVLALVAVGYYYKSHSPAAASSSRPRAQDASKVFVSKVLATTEDAWAEKLSGSGHSYVPPHLVVFRDSVSSACGYSSAAVGPFYCSRDSKVYLDLTFFDDLNARLGAPGDFAQAYVVAHEVGHHVQNLLGISTRARRAGMHLGPDGESVRLELEADCFAGMWGGWAQKKGLLDVGDVEEALTAAQAIGDDTLQKRGRGRVSPETFSHGTSAQRVRWFKKGMAAKDLDTCDTFAASTL